MIVIFVFLICPLIYAVYCSLYNCDYMMFGDFVGLGNFKKVITPENIKALGRSLYLTVVSLGFSLVLGTAVSLWIHRLKGMAAYSLQIIVLIPWVTSMVVAALLWKWIFAGEIGLLNYALLTAGLPPTNLLAKTSTALNTVTFVVMWRTIGYVMVQVLAGLKGIPEEVEEAAMIDGAGRVSMLFRIRLPLVKTQLLISSIILTLSNFNNLTVPLTMTGGGPGTATTVLPIVMQREGFTYYHFGQASALSVIIFAVNLILAVCYIKAVKYEV